MLVRRHGVYVWGPTWQKAKTMSECYDYLFEVCLVPLVPCCCRIGWHLRGSSSARLLVWTAAACRAGVVL